MAGKAKEPRAHDAEAEAATQIYQVAKAESEEKLAAMQEQIGAIREESQAMGALTAIGANIAYNELLRAVTLQRVKQGKEYKKGGMTWDEFCDALGMPRRTVDLMLEDLRPVIDTFSASFAGFCGMPFSKIRLLGKQISANLAGIENGCLVYGDESIPLTPENADDIQALIERIGDETREKVEEAENEVRTAKRLVKSKEDVIKKQERDLARFEKQVKAKGITPEEDSLLAKIDAMGVELNGFCLQLDTLRDAIVQEPFPSAIAGFINLMDNVRMKASSYRATAVDIAPPGMLEAEEDDGWKPPITG